VGLTIEGGVTAAQKRSVGYVDPAYRQTPPPPASMEAMGKFVEKSLKDGTLVDTGGLLPSKDGARVGLANGKITVTDGPFSVFYRFARVRFPPPPPRFHR
jgi:hypothetical protein